MKKRTAPREGLPARVPVAEHIKNIVFIFMVVIGYLQLANPACRGEAHSLPRVLNGFPCHGHLLQKLSFVLRNAHIVLLDILNLHIRERFLSFFTVALLLRLASPFLLPARAYYDLVCPVTSYFVRCIGVLHHLLMGPRHQPSPLALERLFRSLFAFDLCGFVMLQQFWRMHPSLELAHCGLMAVGLLVLAHWYRDRVPGGVNVPWIMATRLAAPAVTLWLIGRMRPRRGNKRGWAAGNSSGAGAEKAGLRTSCPGGVGGESRAAAARAGISCTSAAAADGGGSCAAGASESGGGGGGGGGGAVCGGGVVRRWLRGPISLLRKRYAKQPPVAASGSGGAVEAAKPPPPPPAWLTAWKRRRVLPARGFPAAGAAGVVEAAAASAVACNADQSDPDAAPEEGVAGPKDVPAAAAAACVAVAEAVAVASPARAVAAAPGEAEAAEATRGLAQRGRAAGNAAEVDTAALPEPLATTAMAADGEDAEDEGGGACGGAGGSAAAAPPPLAPQPMVALPPYVPFVRRYTAYYKIPWAEPEQLIPGYEQRMCDLVAARGRDSGRGLRLAAVYVRRGCVELTLVLQEELGEEEGETAVHGKEEEQAQQQQQAGQRAGAAAARPYRPSSSRMPDRKHRRPWEPLEPLEPEEVLRALGLWPLGEAGAAAAAAVVASSAPARTEAGADSNGGCGDGVEAGVSRLSPLLSSVQVRLVEDDKEAKFAAGCAAGNVAGGSAEGSGALLPRAELPAPAPGRSDRGGGSGGGGGGRPRVLNAWPRVLLLEQQPCVAHDVEGSGDGSAVGRDGKWKVAEPDAPAFKLHVVVDWGIAGGEPAPAQTHGSATAAALTESVNDCDAQAEVHCRGGDSGGGPEGGAELLPVQVLNRGATPMDGAAAPSFTYDIELQQMPTRPGNIWVELSLRGRLGAGGGDSRSASGGSGGRPRRVVMQLLAVDDASVAEELAAAAAAGDLENMLCDMGSWAAAASAAIRQGLPSAGPIDVVRRLGAHLLSYARAAGLDATAAWIADGLRHRHYPAAAPIVAAAIAAAAVPAVGVAAANTAIPISCGGNGSGGGGGTRKSELVPPGAIFAAPVATPRLSLSVGGGKGTGHADAGADARDGGDDGGKPYRRSGSGSAARRRRGSWRRALHHFVSEPSPAEAEQLRERIEQWVVHMGWKLQVMESLMLLIVVSREAASGRPLLSMRTVLWAGTMGVDAALLAVRLVLLPYGTWARLTVRARLGRYGCLLLSKLTVALVATAAAPSDGPGVATPSGWLRFLLFEGFILPVTCLLSPRAGALVAATMLSVNTLGLRAFGAVDTDAAAARLAACTGAAALATTVVCHAYLRLSSGGDGGGRHGPSPPPRSRKRAGGEARGIGTSGGPSRPVRSWFQRRRRERRRRSSRH